MNPSSCLKLSACLAYALPVVVAAGLAAPAHAATIERIYQQNAASTCQGALPAFAGTLRARPLGVGNEGAAPTFLTCSFTREGPFDQPVTRVSLHFTNNADAAVTINCTGVFGQQRDETVYLPKSVVVEPGEFGNIAWSAVDNDGNDLPGPGNSSCSLPPGAVMLDTFNYFDVEIGS